MMNMRERLATNYATVIRPPIRYALHVTLSGVAHSPTSHTPHSAINASILSINSDIVSLSGPDFLLTELRT
jgi:hypothetical protein